VAGKRNELDPEAAEQVALIQWSLRNRQQIPALGLLFHVPNGGHRHPTQGALMKLLGVKRGVPDLFLPVPSQAHHGLWIEMKPPTGGVVSDDQKRWHANLADNGYRVEVCRGFQPAKEAILSYLGIPEPTEAFDAMAGVS
jgi:hypothetical protein